MMRCAWSVAVEKEPLLGVFKRYAHVIDARMDQRMVQQLARLHTPA